MTAPTPFVLVAGLGKSGLAACRYFLRRGYRVVACDERDVAGASALSSAFPALELRTGPFDAALFAAARLVVLSPGIDPRHEAVRAAVAEGVPLTNEPSLALERIPLPVLTVTGSAGKTTTVTAAAQMLRASGRRPFLGGNVGAPLLDLLDPSLSEEEQPWRAYDCIVAELSSFQIELLAPFRPKAAVLTTLGADHLDRHGSVEAYHGIKRRLFSWLQDTDAAIVRFDQDTHQPFSASTGARRFGYGTEPAETPAQGAWRAGDTLHFRHPSFTGTIENAPAAALSGANAHNLLAAALGALELGATEEGIRAAVSEFRGLPHRLEFVHERNGVRFVNDSKATNVAAASSALGSFPPKSVVLLAGGKNKGLALEALREPIERACRLVVTFGESGDTIARSLDGRVPVRRSTKLTDAVETALRFAEPGDVVLLSPACASHDEFRDYMERGERFRTLVQRLGV